MSHFQPIRILRLVALSLVAAAFVGASRAEASSLTTGGVLYPAPSVTGVGGATLVATDANVAFTSLTLTGTLTSSVYDNDPNNPNGPTALTFTYLLKNTGGNGFERFTDSKYTGFSTDVGYVTGTGTAPTYIDRPTSDVIGFSFVPSPLGSGVVAAGSTSDLLIVRTDATTYQVTTASVIDGSVASVASFAPSTVERLPEPSSLVLLGFGSVALLGAWRKRRSR